MRAPSKTPSKNLRSQQAGMGGDGRGAEPVEVSAMTNAKPSMIVPGEGQVEDDFGGPMNDRSAANFTKPMSRFGGA